MRSPLYRLCGCILLVCNASTLAAQTVPDPGFGGTGAGFVNLPLNQGGLDRDVGTDMKLRTDGRIVIAGSAQTATGLVAAVYQLGSNGMPDPAFGGGDGRATFVDPNDPTASLVMHALTIQDDGKIVLAGVKDDEHGFVMRVNAGGTALDTSFAPGGAWDLPQTEFRDVVIDSHDRIVLAGQRQIIEILPPQSWVYDRIQVVRLSSTGALDTSFGGDGKPYFDFGTDDRNDYRGRAVVIDHNGRVLVAAEVWTPDHGIDFGVLALLPDGTPDPDFGNYGPIGRARVHFDQTGAACTEDRIADIALHHSFIAPSTDRVLLGGTACRSDGNRDFAIARLYMDGTLDVGFGLTGRQTVAFDLDAAGFDSASAIAFQTPGLLITAPTHVVVAGVALRDISGSNHDIALARLRLTDGSLDPEFGNGGRYLFPIDLGGPDTEFVEAVATTSSRITIAGWISTPLNSGNDRDFLAARFVAEDRMFRNGFE